MRILLVDDDPQILGAIKTVLEFDGHEVVTAQGGQVGIDTFESSIAGPKPFDLVMTDSGMPRVGGRHVARAVKSRSPQIPVVLLTGSGGAPPDSDPADFDLVIGKPCRARELRGAIDRCTSAPAQS